MQNNTVRLPPAIHPGVWVAASLTAETEGGPLYVCVYV